MTSKAVTMVRIYLTEGDGQLKELMTLLHDWEKLKGATVFRGISGFGDTGKVLGSDILDLSLNLPVVVEFFDSPEKVEKIIDDLNRLIRPEHIVSWPANTNVYQP